MLPELPRVVITGAASGLGRALSLVLAARGAHVVAADINMSGAEETARLVEGLGGRAIAHSCDVASRESVGDLHKAASSWLGRVDLLVNNAGVAVAGKVGEIPLADWDWIVGINLWGVVYGCHFFLPAMRAAKRGHILNVASIAGYANAPEMAPYNVTKAGVVALSETLAAEAKPDNVGVTVLCPWFFTTNIHKSARSSASTPISKIEKVMSRSKVQADEVARAAISACDRGQLHVFPHAEAKLTQTLKRLAPEGFHRRLIPMLSRFSK
ncbi:MAG: SDR family NAD(P)-dependent oxidoreductase [Polyangiaceae bacterium]